EGMPIEALEAGLDWDWRSYGDWLNRLDGGLMVNAGFLVGHSAVRRAVMGEAAVGSEASEEQLAAMVRVLHESLTAGGLGFSSSRAPTHNDGDGKPVPSRSATTEELVTLAGAGPVQVRLSFLSGFILEALPGWSSTMSLPPAEKIKALSDPDERRRLRDGAASPDAGMLRAMANWKTMRIAETFAPDNA